MARRTLSFSEWLKTVDTNSGDYGDIAAIKKLSRPEQEIVYAIFKRKYDEQFPGKQGDLTGSDVTGQGAGLGVRPTLDAFHEYHNYASNPAADNRPPEVTAYDEAHGIDPVTPEKAGQAARDAKSKGGKGKAAPSAQEAFAAEIGKLTPLGNTFSWMAPILSGGTGLSQDGSGHDALSDDQVSSWRMESEAAGLGKWKDNASFLADPSVQSGRDEFVSTFKHALNLGPNETVTYYGTPQIAGGREGQLASGLSGRIAQDSPQAVSTQRSWVDAANQEKPGLEQYMNQVILDADKYKVPWQLVWGTLRARASFNPTQQQGVGLLNLDPSKVPADIARDPKAAIQWVAAHLAAGYQQTGDWGLAALAVDSPDSAMSWRTTGHASTGRDGKDAAYITAVFGGTQGGPKSLAAFGFGLQGDEGQHTLLDPILSANSGSNGSGGPTITVPDEATLRATADSQIRSLLFRAPRPDELEAMVRGMRNAIISSQMPQQSSSASSNPYAVAYDGAASPSASQTPTIQTNVSPDSYVIGQIQNSPEYNALYANRGSMTEAEYGQHVASEGEQVLGTRPDDQSIRFGLTTDQPTYEGYLRGEGMQYKSFRQGLYDSAQKLAAIL